mgnify:CR=1 FL=1
MSDQIELPRVEFNDDGLSMSVGQALERVQRLLTSKPGFEFYQDLKICVRPCDCSETLDGLDEYCPLHGDKA